MVRLRDKQHGDSSPLFGMAFCGLQAKFLVLHNEVLCVTPRTCDIEAGEEDQMLGTNYPTLYIVLMVFYL